MNTEPFGRSRDPTLGALDDNTTLTFSNHSVGFANQPTDYKLHRRSWCCEMAIAMAPPTAVFE